MTESKLDSQGQPDRRNLFPCRGGYGNSSRTKVADSTLTGLYYC